MGCTINDIDEENRSDDDILTILDNEMAIGYFPDSETPYVFFDENLYTIMAYDQNLDSTVDGVFLKSGDSQALIYFDPDSYLPTSITSSDGDLISFYYNEELTSVTVKFQYENQDDASVIIETNPDDLTFDAFKRRGISSKKNGGTIAGAKVFLNAATFATSFVTCIVSSAVAVAGIPLTGGLATALTSTTALLSCSSAVAGFAGFFTAQNPNTQLVPTEITTINTAGTAVDAVRCFLQKDIFSCISVGLGIGTIALNELSEYLNNKIVLIDLSGTWVMKFNTATCSQGNIPSGSLIEFIFNLNNTITFVGTYSSLNDGITLVNNYKLNDDSLSINWRTNENGYNSDECNGVYYDFSIDDTINFSGSYQSENKFKGNYTFSSLEVPNYPCADNTNCSGSMRIFKQ
ncbi:MAG: hypothetical protein L3J34_04545 [Flavobacteriaceae bacterium]|nr:hypothetical protein [Flavobacteriaceae bacterium]